MLDDLGIGGFVNVLPGLVSSLVNTLFIILGLIIFGALIFLFIYNKSFTKKVRVRELVNGRVIIKDKLARTVKDDKNVLWWRIKGEKDKLRRFMPNPPASAIDIDYKGNEVVEVYYSSGEYIFLKDMARVAELPKDLFKDVPEEYNHIEDTEQRERSINEWKRNVLAEWKKTNGVVEAFKPFSTQQRVLTVSAVMDAEARRGSNIWKDIPQLAALSALVIIVVSLMIFWGDIAKPVIEAKEVGTQQLQLMQEISISQNEIRQDIQTFQANQNQINTRITEVEKNKAGVPN